MVGGKTMTSIAEEQEAEEVEIEEEGVEEDPNRFFDGDDESKWSGEAARQLEMHPPGQEYSQPSPDHPFVHWRNKYGVPSDGVVVDFGCGTGLLRPVFETLNYIGVDQNPEMVEGIQLRWKDRDPSFCVYQAPLTEIVETHPVLQEVADMGCFCTVLQHNHFDTAAEILDQAFQVLKPGAILVMMEATFIERHYPEETRIKYRLPDPIDPESLEAADQAAIFTVKGWENLLDQHGFDLLEYDGDCMYVSRRRNQ
jgi:SAM-dependent methyltransferase